MKDFKKFSLYEPVKAEYTSTTNDVNNRLKEENAKLRELVLEQSHLTNAVHAYWSGGKTPKQYSDVFKAVLRVTLLAGELEIKV